MGSIAVENDGEIIIGVDPHPGSHTFSAINEIGKVVAELRIANTAAGRKSLWIRAKRFSNRRWAVEGPGNRFAKDLVNDLLAAGEQLQAVSPGMTAEYRKRCRRGKNDEIDAGSAARVVLANGDVPAYLPEPYEARLKELTRTYQRLVSQRRATKMSLKDREYRDVQETMQRVVKALDSAIQELKAKIQEMVKELAPELLKIQGVGPIVAGIMLAEVGRIERFSNADKFAAYAGCAPIPWASGASEIVRVNPGGNRRLNYAAHIVVMSRLRIDSRTKQYRDRKREQGKTQREVFRLLKTYVCRELFKALKSRCQLAVAA